MKATRIILVLSILVSLGAALAGAADCPGARLGASLAVPEVTPVATILDHPEQFVGKAVRIEGVVKDVCSKMGCWMTVAATEGERELRVKVQDGVIVFPVSARGKKAIAEGTVETAELTREAYLKAQEHMAEEQGRTFDASKVGEGPFKTVQIKGTGAIVCEAGS